MFRAPHILILSLMLAGCAASPSIQAFNDSSGAPRYAWDGAGEDPNIPKLSSASRASAATRARPEVAKELPAQRASSVTALDGADPDEAERDARLSRKLVICRGCLRQQESDERMARLRD